LKRRAPCEAGNRAAPPAAGSSERVARESGDEETIDGAHGETDACCAFAFAFAFGFAFGFGFGFGFGFVCWVGRETLQLGGRGPRTSGNGGVKMRSELAKPICIDDCDVTHVVSVGSHGGAVDDAVWSRSEEGGRGMDAELSGARARARRAERVEYRTVGAAAVGCERSGVGKESRGDGSTDGDGVGTAGRVGDDAQSGEVLAKLVSHVARSQ